MFEFHKLKLINNFRLQTAQLPRGSLCSSVLFRAILIKLSLL